MTIDEAIECERNHRLYPEYHEQIAEWLEELKTLRLDSCMIHLPERLQLVENGYNKALNDFVNACEKQFVYQLFSDFLLQSYFLFGLLHLIMS